MKKILGNYIQSFRTLIKPSSYDRTTNSVKFTKVQSYDIERISDIQKEVHMVDINQTLNITVDEGVLMKKYIDSTVDKYSKGEIYLSKQQISNLRFVEDNLNLQLKGISKKNGKQMIRVNKVFFERVFNEYLHDKEKFNKQDYHPLDNY